LIVKTRVHNNAERRAVITKVGSGGEAPFTVRWTDDGREALVFPGPDAHLVTAGQLAERNREQSERIAAVQSAITAGHPGRP
jgi:hypothetical protein